MGPEAGDRTLIKADAIFLPTSPTYLSDRPAGVARACPRDPLATGQVQPDTISGWLARNDAMAHGPSPLAAAWAPPSGLRSWRRSHVLRRRRQQRRWGD